MISKKGKGSTKKPAIYIPPGQLARGLGRGKGVKTNKVLVDEQESNERINGGIENHTLTLHYGGKQVKDNDFSEDYSYLDILKLCSKFINVNDIGFKIMNGDGRKLENDANVLALLEEHEGVENIELYLELDDSAKPLPFKLPKDALVMAHMTSEKDTTQLGEKDKEYVGNTSQMRSVYGRGGAQRGNHGSSSQSAEVEEVGHLKKHLKSLESEVNLVHELVEENKHLKNEMAELRSLVQKLAGKKSGNSSSGPSHIPSINDDRDVCDDDKVNSAGEDSDGTRDDGVKDKSCVGPGFSFDGSV